MIMNDIIKQKISKSRKEYLKNHPDEHPWKNLINLNQNRVNI